MYVCYTWNGHRVISQYPTNAANMPSAYDKFSFACVCIISDVQVVPLTGSSIVYRTASLYQGLIKRRGHACIQLRDSANLIITS